VKAGHRLWLIWSVLRIFALYSSRTKKPEHCTALGPRNQNTVAIVARKQFKYSMIWSSCRYLFQNAEPVFIVARWKVYIDPHWILTKVTDGSLKIF
jgi:hypothetical protein